MQVARPAGVDQLARFLAGRGRATGPPVVTGEPEPIGEAARRALEATGADLVATGELDGAVAYRPRDLVITVRAGTRLTSLREILGREGQWLPPAEPGEMDAMPGTVGGLVAAAPAGPFDAAFGPVRRQLLACRVVARDGSVRRWGRAVMKDVAGYAFQALHVGSRGRLGALVEASFRTWPRPDEAERWTLAPLGGEPPIELARRLATGPAGEAPAPDALVWRWRSGGPAGGRIELDLLGSTESVAARRRRLDAWAQARNARLEPLEEREARSGVERDRSLRRVVVRLTTAPTRLADVATRAAGLLPPPSGRVEAFPAAGVLRCVWERQPLRNGSARTLRTLLDAVGPEVTAMIERGGAAEHAHAVGRADASVRALEDRVVQALGGGPRHWVADYL